MRAGGARTGGGVSPAPGAGCTTLARAGGLHLV